MRLLALAALALAGCATVPPPSAPAPAPRIAQAGVAFTDKAELGAFAEGLADPATGRLLTPDDPARVASVSKLVVAIKVLQLVEAGTLDLDRDVSAYLGWSLRNPAFPDRPINLRQLLTHTSSIRDHDDQYAIPLGETVAAAMAQPTSWDAARGPGDDFFTYANIHFPIIASIIEAVMQERFDRVMRRDIFGPLGIDACFNWPTCSDAAIARAVVLTRGGEVIRDNLKGRRPDCPVFVREGVACDLSRWQPGVNGALFSPQGGLRISVRGLARIGQMLLNQGEIGGKRLLSRRWVDALLAQRWLFEANNGATENFYCSYGFATQALIADYPGCAPLPDLRGWSLKGHAGEAYGLRSGLWIDPVLRIGIAYFVTGQPDSTPGNATMTEAEAAAFSRALALHPPRR
jgi:CubicO group peptidase (beta-lactamase class C family)